MTFNSDSRLPTPETFNIGLGTYKLKPEQAYTIVRMALDIGYRHIDTASLYRNEKAVGDAIKDSPIDRHLITVTTKISKKDILKGNLQNAIEKSLKKLNLGYIDRLLLHTPDGDIKSTWSRFSSLHQNQYRSLVKEIGVSNYQQCHLESILQLDLPRPIVNQIEMSPFLPRHKLRKYCLEQNIGVEAHSCLTKGQLLSDPLLLEIIDRFFPQGDITPANLLLQWALHHQVKVIPRSSQFSHLQANFNLPPLTFSSDLLKAMSKLDRGFSTHPQHLFY